MDEPPLTRAMWIDLAERVKRYVVTDAEFQQCPVCHAPLRQTGLTVLLPTDGSFEIRVWSDVAGQRCARLTIHWAWCHHNARRTRAAVSLARPVPLTGFQEEALRLLVEYGHALNSTRTTAPPPDLPESSPARVAWIDGRVAAALARRGLAARGQDGWVPTAAGCDWVAGRSGG